jgi:hypothetical protein
VDNPRKPQNSAQKSAQSFFTKSGQDESLAKQTRKKERTAVTAKTAKLRELRLAKEAADKVESDRMAAEHPAPARPERRKRAPVAKAPKVMRFTY